MGSQPRVSAIMITGDVIAHSPGQAIFERALQAVAWADELVIVDSASADATREVASRYTDKVYVHPFQNSLMLQKKIALRYCTGDWILWVDADEVLPPPLIAEIQAVVRAPGPPLCNGYAIARQHYFVGRVLQHAGEDCKVRLWRCGVGAWAGDDNDDYYTVPAPEGRFRTPMEHYSTASLDWRLQKMVHFAPAHAALAPPPERADYTLGDTWRRLLKPPLQRFYGIYWLQRGYKDGVRGLIWAVVCVMTEFCKDILIWERAQGVGLAAAAEAETEPPAAKGQPH